MKLRIALALLTAGLIAVGVLLPSTNPAQAATGINKTINYQGRLLSNTGAVVPDGTYNMRFKIYQDGDGVLGGGDETLKWTEEYLNSLSQGVVVRNGYFSVALGTYCAFDGSACTGGQTQTNTNVDFDQTVLWLSMDVGGTASGAFTYDGEMTPFKRLSSAVYALQAESANKLGGLTSGQFVQNVAPNAAQQTANINIVSGAAANVATAQIQAVASATAPVLVLKGGATPGSGADLLQLQNASSATPLARFNSNGDLLIGGTASQNSLTALQVQDNGGGNVLVVDTSDDRVGIGPGITTPNATLQVAGTLRVSGQVTLSGGLSPDITTPGANTATGLTMQPGTSSGASSNGGDVKIKGGNGSGTTSVTGGNLTLQGGDATGASGTRNGGSVFIDGGIGQNSWGSVNIATVGSANKTVNIGNSALSTGTQTINIGTANTAGGTTNVVIGTTGSAAGTTTVQAMGALTLTGGAASTWQTMSGALTVQGAAGASLLTAATNATSTNSGDLTLGTGNAAGTTSNSGSISLNVGTATGTAGNINIGTANIANTIQLGSTTLGAGTQTINIGNNATPGGVTNIALGATTSGSTTSLQAGTGGLTANTTGNASYTANGTITITAGGASTWSTSSGNLIIQAAGTSNLNLQTGGAGTVNLGNQNSTTINIGAGSNIVRTFHIGDGGSSQAQTITLGSTGGASATTIQGGNGAGAVSIQSAASGTIGIGSSNTANTVQIGSTALSAGTQTINIGNNGTAGGTTNVVIGTTGSAAGTTTLQGGGGVSVLTANVSGASGAILIQAGNSSGGTAGNVTVDTGTTSTGTPTVNIGSTNAKAVQIGNNSSNPAVNIDSGTGTINIGTGAQARATNVGTGLAVQTVNVGSATGASATTIQSGSGNLTLQTNSSAASVLVKTGTNAANAFQIQNSSGNQLINVGTVGNTSNLIPNPSFETNSALSWSQVNGTVAVSRVTSDHYAGTASMQAVNSTAGQWAGVKYNITLTPNTSYGFSFYVRAQSGITQVTGGYSNTGALSGESDCRSSTEAVSTSGWVRYSCVINTPASNSGTPYVYIEQADAVTSSFLVDAVTLVQKNIDTGGYYDGTVDLSSAVISSPVTLQNSVDSNAALQVFSSAGYPIFVVDTLGKQSVATGTLLVTNDFYGSVNSFRVTTSGPNITLEASGSDLVLSGWTSTGFTGSQINWLRGNAANQVLYVGGGSASSSPTLLVLDNKNTSGDPTGRVGGMYYNSNTNKFRCYENSQWKDCLGNQSIRRVARADNTVLATSASTTPVQIESVTVSVQPSHVYHISAVVPAFSNTTGDQMRATLRTGSITGTAIDNSLAEKQMLGGDEVHNLTLDADYVTGSSETSTTFVVGGFRYAGSGTVTFEAFSAQPYLFRIEDTGRASLDSF